MREVEFTTEFWELRIPFTITGHTFSGVEVLLVTLSENGCTGRGEGAGVCGMELGQSARPTSLDPIRGGPAPVFDEPLAQARPFVVRQATCGKEERGGEI